MTPCEGQKGLCFISASRGQIHLVVCRCHEAPACAHTPEVYLNSLEKLRLSHIMMIIFSNKKGKKYQFIVYSISI